MEGSTIECDFKGNAPAIPAVHFEETLAKSVRETESAAKEAIKREQEMRRKAEEKPPANQRLYTFD